MSEFLNYDFIFHILKRILVDNSFQLPNMSKKGVCKRCSFLQSRWRVTIGLMETMIFENYFVFSLIFEYAHLIEKFLYSDNSNIRIIFEYSKNHIQFILKRMNLRISTHSRNFKLFKYHNRPLFGSFQILK